MRFINLLLITTLAACSSSANVHKEMSRSEKRVQQISSSDTDSLISPQESSVVAPAIWYEGSTPGELRIQKHSTPIEVTAYAINRDGVQQQIWQQELVSETHLTLPAQPFGVAGFYRLQIGHNNADVLEVAVIARPLARTPAPPLFGVNTHFSQRMISDTAYEILKLGNVDIIRDQWVWDNVEKGKGNIQSPIAPNGGVAHQKAMLLDNNLRILHNCAYGNRAYDDRKFPSSLEGIKAFANYCGFIAREYGNALYGSEIWNESNTINPATGYAPLALETSNVLKSLVPSAEIIEGGGAGPGGGADPTYEEGVYHAIGAACCTGHSIHPYMTNPDVGYFALHSRLNNPNTGQSIVNMDSVTFWSDVLSHSVGKLRSSNITEIGWYSYIDGKDGVSDEKQAAYVSRALIHASKPSACTWTADVPLKNLAKSCNPSNTATTPDLKLILIYDFQNDGIDRAQREQNFGLVRSNLTPKMSYSAFAQATGILRGTSFYRAVKFGNRSVMNANIYKSAENEGWLVMWTSEYVPGGLLKSADEMNYSHEGHTHAFVSLENTMANGQPDHLIQLACREWDGHPCSTENNSVEVTNLPIFIKVRGILPSLQITENR